MPVHIQKDMKINKKIPVVGALILLFSAFSFGVQAQVIIEELQQAELPLALIPDARKKIVLKPNGNLAAATNADIVGGHAVSGHYRISSDTEQSITIDVMSTEDDPKIVLKNFKLKYQGVTYKKPPVTGLPSPGSGEDLFIGFTVILKSGAGEGERFLSYTIDVIEE